MNYMEQKGANRHERPSLLRQTTEIWPKGRPSIVTEAAFIKNAYQGVGIALLFAFIILIYATLTLLLATSSILSRACRRFSFLCCHSHREHDGNPVTK